VEKQRRREDVKNYVVDQNIVVCIPGDDYLGKDANPKPLGPSHRRPHHRLWPNANRMKGASQPKSQKPLAGLARLHNEVKQINKRECFLLLVKC
jgi:hypothetical protein